MADHDSSQRSNAAAVPIVAALLLVIFGVYPLANTLTEGEAVQWYAHSVRFWVSVGGAIILALLIAGRLLAAPLERLWRTVSGWILAIPTPVFVGCVALFAIAASAILETICFGRQPHNADEVAQLFHAKILLSGRLSLPVVPNPEFFAMDNMIDSGRWYSQFPIGGPAILALGMGLHAAWLVNPVLLGVTVVALFSFTSRTYGDSLARATVLLFALSPFALFMSASFMNHTPVLCLATIALAQFAEWTDVDDSRRLDRSAAVIGIALGISFTVRPLDALVVAGVIGAMQLTMLRTNARRWRSIAFQVVGGLVPVALFFVVNARTNGSPMKLGYEVLYGSAHQLGFHLDPYGTMHTPVKALTFASKYLLELNVMMFGWPLPAVGIIVAGLCAMRRPTKWDIFLIAFLLVQIIAYALYWHDGAFRGPRFLFTALPAIVILTARAPFLIAGMSRGAVRIASLYVAPVCIAIAWFAPGVGNSVPNQVRLYQRAAPVGRVDADSVKRAAGLHNALVFINEGREARNLHDLWALGISRGDAARISVSASACAVRVALAAEWEHNSSSSRVDRIVLVSHAVDAQVPPVMPPMCVYEARRDDGGTASFAPFFTADEIDSTGHIGGDVIYVHDLGLRNEVLRARFPGRAWYRFGPRPKSEELPKPVPYTDAP